MKTFDISLTHNFDQVLYLRERELCAVLDARERLAAAVGDRNDVSDFKDVAAGQSLAAVDDAQAEHIALELEQVLAARRRLQDHNYGRCLDCDDAIDMDRLAVMPATRYCTACQEAQEHAASVAHLH